MVQVLPIALSDLKLATETLRQHVRANGNAISLCSQQSRQHVKAVRRICVIQLIVDNRSDRCKDIGRIRHLVSDLSRWNFSGPPCDKRHSMASFPAITLHTSPASGCIMVVILPHPVNMQRLGPIVGIEDHQRVVVDP